MRCKKDNLASASGNSVAGTVFFSKAMAAFTTAFLLCMGGVAGAAINIETVHVGNPGNAADPGTLSQFGSVNYVYDIGKYEVTEGQYTAFLNAVAAADPYGLYNPNMAAVPAGGIASDITRSGSPGHFSYSVDTNFVNRPIDWVSWGDAARFANWLSNGQPTGTEDAGTTEQGSYTLNGAVSNAALNAVTRNSDATWVIPNEDEWYKAAYYDPTLNSGAGGYNRSPIAGSTGAPGRDLTDTSGNNANYYDGSGPYPIDSPYFTTIVGQFANSASPYGTFDQGGNVAELNETLDGTGRKHLGGAFNDGDIAIGPSSYGFGTSTDEDSTVGFRIAEVPEPGAMALLSLGGFALLVRRRWSHVLASKARG